MPPRADDAALARIEGKLDRLDIRVASIEQRQPLADYLSTQAETRFDRLEVQLVELREYRAGAVTSSTDRRWLMATAFSTCSLVVAIGALVARIAGA